MKISLAKTHFLAIRGTPAERSWIHLTIEGVPLQPAPQDWVRVLGVPVHQNGGATEWIKQLRPQWRSLLHLIRRISNTFGGASQDIARRLVQGVLVTKATYGAMCYSLTKNQNRQLEILYREAFRAITGLPRRTRIEELYRYAGLPLSKA